MQQLLEEVSQEKEKLQLQLNEATIRSDRVVSRSIYMFLMRERKPNLKLSVNFTLKEMCHILRAKFRSVTKSGTCCILSLCPYQFCSIFSYISEFSPCVLPHSL